MSNFNPGPAISGSNTDPLATQSYVQNFVGANTSPVFVPATLDTTGISLAALSAFNAGGGVVKLPAKTITLTAPLPMYNGVIYEGTGFGINEGGASAFVPTGTVLQGNGVGGAPGTYDCFSYNATPATAPPNSSGTVAFTVPVLVNATSAILTGSITNGIHLFVFNGGDSRLVTVTGGTACSWTTGLTVASTTATYNDNSAFQARMLTGGGIRSLSITGFKYGVHIGDYYNPGWQGGLINQVFVYNCQWGFFIENFDACQFRYMWAMQCGVASTFSGGGFFGQSSNGNFNNGDSLFDHLASFTVNGPWGWLFMARGQGFDSLNNNTINYVTESSAVSQTVQVASTTNGSASITVTDTTKFQVGQPVAFFGLGHAGITNGLCYFVSSIIDATHLTITTNCIDPLQTQYWTNLSATATVNGPSGFPLSVTNANPLATITNTAFDQDWPGWAGFPGRSLHATPILFGGFSGGAAGNNGLYYVLQQQGGTTFWLTRDTSGGGNGPPNLAQKTPVSSSLAYSGWTTSAAGFAQPCIMSWGMPAIGFVATGPNNNIQPHTVTCAGVEAGTTGNVGRTCAFLFQRCNSIDLGINDFILGAQGVNYLQAAVYRTASGVVVRTPSLWSTDADNGSGFNQILGRMPTEYTGLRQAPALTFRTAQPIGVSGLTADTSGRYQTTAPGSAAIYLNAQVGPDIAFNANQFVELGCTFPIGIPGYTFPDGTTLSVSSGKSSLMVYSGSGGAGLSLPTIGAYGDGLVLFVVNPTASACAVASAGGQKIINGDLAGSLVATTSSVASGKSGLFIAYYNDTYNGQGTATNYNWIRLF